MKKILLVTFLSFASTLGFALHASNAEACNQGHSSYHCHWRYGQRYCHGRPLTYYPAKPYKTSVYQVAGYRPTPQCHWYLGRQYCAWH